MPPASPPGYPPYPPPPPPLVPQPQAVAAAPAYAPASNAEHILRRIDPDLRRFVSSYARRRSQLTLDVRVQLAANMQQSLQRAVPDTFAQYGPLAVLDYLANLDLA